MEEIELLILSLLDEFKIQHQAIANGNHRRNNKSVDRASNLFKAIRNSGKVDELLKSLDTNLPEIQASVAVYCLPIDEEGCLGVLKNIRDNNNTFLGVQAEYAIKNWENDQYTLWDD